MTLLNPLNLRVLVLLDHVIFVVLHILDISAPECFMAYGVDYPGWKTRRGYRGLCATEE